MSREDVFKAIDSERDYQQRRWGVRQENGTFKEIPRSVEQFILYMEDYLLQAKHQITREAGEFTSKETIRKVVTLGVACLEQHGVVPRNKHVLVENALDNRPA
jgi:hypothetical protein